MNPLSMTGRKIGRWTVLAQAESHAGVTRWSCRCDCGSERVVSRSVLMESRNKQKSCGCWRRERISLANFRHGRTHSPAWNSWSSMLTRCYNSNTKQYHWYGARGIAVCARWRAFANFLSDMGERPAGKTLDRFPNNDGNYEPGNCRWATPKQQAANRRRVA